ncbi:MAG: hypothetical protein H6709_15980 [Kofleriaceae bacterium]|nr:hypothetical protein [Myxococcales bacterium]MCB9563825.1 hypothetical protein [Kofleriaceae bacterium]MCB9573578.1 hypothetical protein [Kofleriaceae bacterium]
MSWKLLGPCLLCAAVLTTGCKGKITYKDTPETVSKLESMERQMADKDTLIQSLRDDNARLEREGGAAGGEYVFTIEGDALSLKTKPSHGGGGGSIDDATATALSGQFLDLVQKSRGSIQKCYEQALKKSPGLQARTVTLKLSASFNTAGKFTRVTFSPPDLPDLFDSCLRGVAGKWQMPAAPAAMTFQAQLSLTPT